MKKILVTRKLLKENEDKLSELFETKLNLGDKIYSAQEIIEESKDCDGILSSVTDPINSDTISKLSSSIKIIANLIEDLEQINFVHHPLDGGWLAGYKDQEDYIREKLKNYSWTNGVIDISNKSYKNKMFLKKNVII